jgi:exopolysaccharide biosynthesis polyprenyl glycosylphosphotransferase
MTSYIRESLPEPAQPKTRTSFPRLGALAMDTAMLAGVFAATSLGASAATGPPQFRSWVVFALSFIAVMALRGLYRERLRTSGMDEFAGVLFAASLASVATLAEWELSGATSGAGRDVLRLFVFTAVYVGGGRIAVLRMVREARLEGEYLRPTLIVGAGRVGRLVARRLRDAPELGLRPIGFLDKDPLGPLPDGDSALPVLGASWDLERVLAAHHVEQVLIAFSTAPDDVILRLVRRCDELGVRVAYVPRFFEKITRRLTVDHIGGLPLISASAPDPRGMQFAIKYALDRVLAGLLLIAVAPIIGAAVLAVRIRMGSPVFFRQQRVGLDGRQFEILKLRSMTVTAEFEDEPAITGLGAFLRRTSIDELPQLLNVIRGDMSLVGPRPERPELADGFARQIYRYGERHRAKSGITGWAQVHGLGRGPERFGERALAERVEWDNYYIENWSLLLDLKILFLTARALLRFAQSDTGNDHVEALSAEEEPARAPAARTAA